MAVSDKLRDRLTKLFALLGSNNAGEWAAARNKIEELLAKNKKTWNDLTELLATGNAQGWHDAEPDVGQASGAAAARPASLDLIRHILERHLSLTEHQLVAVTLWIAHTFVFTRFSRQDRFITVASADGDEKEGQRENPGRAKGGYSSLQNRPAREAGAVITSIHCWNFLELPPY
jgi:hypothetical protein